MIDSDYFGRAYTVCRSGIVSINLVKHLLMRAPGTGRSVVKDR
jgi:hypothetical protein